MGLNSVTSTSTHLTPGARENADLTNILEKLKLQQAIAAAKGGTSAGESPAQLQAARLAAALQQQQASVGSNQAMQTQRLQSGSADQSARLQSSERMTAAQLAGQLQQLQTRQGGDRTIQGDRLQSSERINATQLAGQLQRQGIDIKGKRDLQTDASGLEEKRRKDAATRALALFRSAPGGGGSKLNMAAAAAELG